MLDTPILYISLDAKFLEEKVCLLADNRPLFLVTTECHIFFFVNCNKLMKESVASQVVLELHVDLRFLLHQIPIYM